MVRFGQIAFLFDPEDARSRFETQKLRFSDVLIATQHLITWLSSGERPDEYSNPALSPPSLIARLQAIAAEVRDLEPLMQIASTDKSVQAAVIINFGRLSEVMETLTNILGGGVGCPT